MPAFAADALQVNLVFVAGEEAGYDMHRFGAELGVTEGNIQGQFLGINYTLEELSAEQALSVDAEQLPAAVIAAGSESLLRELAAAYSSHGVAVFNIALGDDALRSACIAGLYHTPPSEQMLSDARDQWLQQNPDSSDGELTVVAWHPGFFKFAGRDLNRRFTEQFDVAMDSDAWAGWAATRGLAEAVIRTMSNEPSVIHDYVRDTLAFDGQKGVAQSYRDTGQLRQPLLIVENDEPIGEAPVRGVAASTELDTLGIAECQ